MVIMVQTTPPTKCALGPDSDFTNRVCLFVAQSLVPRVLKCRRVPGLQVKVLISPRLFMHLLTRLLSRFRTCRRVAKSPPESPVTVLVVKTESGAMSIIMSATARPTDSTNVSAFMTATILAKSRAKFRSRLLFIRLILPIIWSTRLLRVRSLTKSSGTWSSPLSVLMCTLCIALQDRWPI